MMNNIKNINIFILNNKIKIIIILSQKIIMNNNNIFIIIHYDFSGGEGVFFDNYIRIIIISFLEKI